MLKPESEARVKYDGDHRLVSGHPMKQITFIPRHHQLTNTNTWTPGSHAHVFSPNGELVSFTYNYHVLHERDPALELRNVGVAARIQR